MKILINNKKAFYNYEIIDKYEAGIILNGPELKSILSGNISISEAYVDINDGEAWLKQCHIDHYKSAKGFEASISETRSRKLLLHKIEIEKLQKKVKEKGLTVTVLDFHYNDHNKVKVEIALVRGKKVYDKRETIKQRDLARRE